MVFYRVGSPYFKREVHLSVYLPGEYFYLLRENILIKDWVFADFAIIQLKEKVTIKDLIEIPSTEAISLIVSKFPPKLIFEGIAKEFTFTLQNNIPEFSKLVWGITAKYEKPFDVEGKVTIPSLIETMDFQAVLNGFYTDTLTINPPTLKIVETEQGLRISVEGYDAERFGWNLYRSETEPVIKDENLKWWAKVPMIDETLEAGKTYLYQAVVNGFETGIMEVTT